MGTRPIQEFENENIHSSEATGLSSEGLVVLPGETHP